MARDNPRCLPPTRTLRRIRWPLQPRSHDRRTTFRCSCDDRWTTLSRHPGSWPVLHQITWMKADRQLRFADVVPDTCVPDATPTRPPFTRTATLFGALRASLFEARMLPADF